MGKIENVRFKKAGINNDLPPYKCTREFYEKAPVLNITRTSKYLQPIKRQKDRK